MLIEYLFYLLINGSQIWISHRSTPQNSWAIFSIVNEPFFSILVIFLLAVHTLELISITRNSRWQGRIHDWVLCRICVGFANTVVIRSNVLVRFSISLLCDVILGICQIHLYRCVHIAVTVDPNFLLQPWDSFHFTDRVFYFQFGLFCLSKWIHIVRSKYN